MCGIAGMMTRNGAAPDAEALRAMQRALAHRGPDGVGHYRKDDVAMVQTRLAIIDLVTGDQPLYEPQGAALVANGEIYNYIELRSEFPGIELKTASDCELPLHLYRRHGLDFPKHLRGMYAIALHDPASRRLVLSRDPFGIKPLYYLERADGLAFASEPEAFIAAGLIAPALVPEARDELLQLQYTTGRQTALAGVMRVLPGETLVVEQGRVVERRRITEVPNSAPKQQGKETASAIFDEIFLDSIRLHVRSDVPYGMFLSGGIDSSAVLAMMARLNERSLTAFTIGFDAPGAADERAQARALAQSLRARHIELNFGEADFWHLLPQVARAMDDPAADYAALPTYKLGEAARANGIKVILSGEGGDEMFAGYARHRRVVLPWWLGGRQPKRHGAFERIGLLRSDSTSWRVGIERAARDTATPERTALQSVQAADCAEWLPNSLLSKLDRCLMAHGVEGRTPFLDKRVAEFAFGLPDDLKVRRGLGKYLVRRWLGEHVAAARPFARKQGFTVPVGVWIEQQSARLGPLVAKQPAIAEICVPGAVESLFAHASDRRFNAPAWRLLFYAVWHRLHIERRPAGADAFETLV